MMIATKLGMTNVPTIPVVIANKIEANKQSLMRSQRFPEGEVAYWSSAVNYLFEYWSGKLTKVGTFSQDRRKSFSKE